jgi:hypothetical protein
MEPITCQSRFRRAWQALGWGAATFVVAQLALAVGFHRWLPESRDPAYGAKLKQLHERLRQSPTPPELVVMLGSSRTAYGFDGSLLEADLSADAGKPAIVYNLGRMGGGPIAESIYLQRLLADGIRPTLLLVEVPPYILSREGSAHEAESLQVGPLDPKERDLLHAFGEEAEEGLPRWVDRSVPVYSRRRVILYKLTPSLLGRDVRSTCRLQWWRQLNASGWSPLERPGSHQEIEDAHMRSAGPLIAKLQGVALGNDLPACRALEHVVQLAQHERIPVALVVMPEGPRLRQAYPENSWERIWAYLQDFGTRHHCPVINGRDWVEGKHFADPDHLGPTGAKQFTERLGREHLRPIWGRLHHGGNGPLAAQ